LLKRNFAQISARLLQDHIQRVEQALQVPAIQRETAFALIPIDLAVKPETLRQVADVPLEFLQCKPCDDIRCRRSRFPCLTLHPSVRLPSV